MILKKMIKYKQIKQIKQIKQNYFNNNCKEKKKKVNAYELKLKREIIIIYIHFISFHFIP